MSSRTIAKTSGDSRRIAELQLLAATYELGDLTYACGRLRAARPSNRLPALRIPPTLESPYSHRLPEAGRVRLRLV